MNIRLEGVTVWRGKRATLRDLSADISAPGLTCLLGSNGAGKTTLFRVLTGEIRPASGKYLVDGRDVTGASQKELARCFATIPQNVQDPPSFTAGEVVALGRFRPGRSMLWRLTDEDRRVVDECLRRCNVGPLAARRMEELSGGEKQRAWLAFGLAQEKPFLLLDEALDALDVLARRAFFQLLRDVAADGRGVLLTTHDLGLAAEYAERLIVLNAGAAVYQGPPQPDLARLFVPR